MTPRRSRSRLAALLLAAVALLGASSSPAGASAGTPRASATVAPKPPVLAYYYIWFNPTSWNRVKRDLPLLGKYSSSEASVMAKHITAAKQAGITGFLVSWKSTPALDARLATLVTAARAADFHLEIVYEGLDFFRQPLPVDRVQHDLVAFKERWGSDPVFTGSGKASVIWAGTWRFTPADVAKVARAVRPGLSLLASEKNTARWSELAAHVDGNAYYWSSVDPDRDVKAADRLRQMGEAVHATGGRWIAPVAPGFDARLIGGTRMVARNGGQTLRREWSAAMTSAPDALGLISWNEFTEGTYVEPSRTYGSTALQTVAELTGGSGPQGELDSSAPSGRSSAGPWRFLVIAALLALLFAAALVRSRERIRRPIWRRARVRLP